MFQLQSAACTALIYNTQANATDTREIQFNAINRIRCYGFANFRYRKRHNPVGIFEQGLLSYVKNMSHQHTHSRHDMFHMSLRFLMIHESHRQFRIRQAGYVHECVSCKNAKPSTNTSTKSSQTLTKKHDSVPIPVCTAPIQQPSQCHDSSAHARRYKQTAAAAAAAVVRRHGNATRHERLQHTFAR